MRSDTTLVIACSTIADGTMKARHTEEEPAVNNNRERFLAKHDIGIANTSLVRLLYEGGEYCRYTTLNEQNKGDGMIRPPHFTVDGVVVTQPGYALFLPLADCIGAVIHDPTKGILMLSHLGRHNLEQFGGTKSIEYLMKEHGVNPHNVTVWLSPAASKDYYPLYSFDNRSLHDVAIEQFMAAGVLQENIEASSIDSAADRSYHSHSEFLKGNRPDDGRFAVVAMMK